MDDRHCVGKKGCVHVCLWGAYIIKDESMQQWRFATLVVVALTRGKSDTTRTATQVRTTISEWSLQIE